MSHETRRQQLDLVSRQEGRRILLATAAVLVLLGWLFGNDMGGGPAAPAPPASQGVPVGTRPQDPEVQLRTLRQVAAEEEQAGGRPAAPAPPAPEPFQLDPAVLSGVQDFALDVYEEPALYQLVARVHTLPDEEITAACDREGFRLEQLLTPEARAQVRGKFIRLQGTFHSRIEQWVLARYPNEAGLAWVWRGLFRANGTEWFVTLTDKDFEPETGLHGTPLEIEGAFLKVYEYTFRDAMGRDGKLALPHLVVKRIRRLPPPARPAPPLFVVWVLVGMLGVVTLGTWLYARRARQRDAEFEAWRRQRRAERRRSEHPPGPEGGPPATDGPTVAPDAVVAPPAADPVSPGDPAPPPPSPTAPGEAPAPGPDAPPGDRPA